MRNVNPRHVLAMLTIVVLLPSRASADDERRERWGITVWGLSYHVNDSIDYAASNWGLGVRYYILPRRLFVEADALRNSNRGVVLPLTAGLEVGIGTLAGARLSVMGALTMAYYQNPRRDKSEVKIGPVPGMTIGWRRVKTNVVAVLSKSDQPLAAIVASLTVLF